MAIAECPQQHGGKVHQLVLDEGEVWRVYSHLSWTHKQGMTCSSHGHHFSYHATMQSVLVGRRVSSGKDVWQNDPSELPPWEQFSEWEEQQHNSDQETWGLLYTRLLQRH